MRALPLAAACAVSWLTPAAFAADLTRGGLLYARHCSYCHASVVRVRRDHRAATLTRVRREVLRWSDYLALGWTDAEVDDVLYYLDREFYHYRRPAGR